MNIDTTQALANVTTRQKLMGLVFVVIVFGILWQAYAMFSGGKSVPAPAPVTTMNAMTAFSPNGPSAAMPGTKTPMPSSQPSQPPPQPTQFTSDQSATAQNELELMRLQQETQAKYISALNELQMLKVAKDIAEANQAIMAARLNTVTSEKKIVDTLAPQTQIAPQGQVVSEAQAPPSAPTFNNQKIQQSYSVVSVTQIQHRWTAVLSNQGNLYNVSIGDVLPADGAKVISINRTGVVLEQNGVQKKFSLVPII